MTRNKYSEELLGPVVARCETWAQVCRELGVRPMTGSQTHIKKRAVEFGLDYSHFKGKAFNKGRTFTKKSIEEYLVEESTAKSGHLRKRLISSGLKEAECEICHLTEWLDQPIPLELDHINSDHWDNRLENLQILCPNCHALETTGRKIKRE